MKIIISHDVDHLTLWEHVFKDTIVPKFYLRSYLEFFKRKISLNELIKRHGDIFYNKWNGIEEIMNFNKSENITSTFFFGMSNGLGLSYNYLDTKKYIRLLLQNNFEVGVHGISFDNDKNMKIELDRFKQVSGLEKFGIRMHYLRKNDKTIDKIKNLGYSFDSTDSEFKESSYNDNFFQFPIHLMDGWIMYADKKYQNVNLEEAKARTKLIIKNALEKKIDFFSFLFHDCYFSDRYKTWMDWYIWTIKYLKEQNFEFITYSDAINLIKNK